MINPHVHAAVPGKCTIEWVRISYHNKPRFLPQVTLVCMTLKKCKTCLRTNHFYEEIYMSMHYFWDQLENTIIWFTLYIFLVHLTTLNSLVRWKHFKLVQQQSWLLSFWRVKLGEGRGRSSKSNLWSVISSMCVGTRVHNEGEPTPSTAKPTRNV